MPSTTQSWRLTVPTRLASLSALLTVLLVIPGCVTMGSADRRANPPVTFCSIAQPIFWSVTDDVRTVTEIKEHNAVFKELCLK